MGNGTKRKAPTLPQGNKPPSSKKPKVPMKDLIDSEIVHIMVGPDVRDFAIHKTLLCSTSPYFKAAFTSGFQETSSGIMKLPETEVEVFKLFTEWLYSGTICINKQNHPTGEDALSLYVFADMIQSSRLKNVAIDTVYEIIDITNKLPPNMFRYVWDNTRENSNLRKLVIDMWKFETNPRLINWVGKLTEEELPRAICLELLTEMMSFIESTVDKEKIPENPLLDLTNYHETEDPEESAVGKSGTHKAKKGYKV